MKQQQQQRDNNNNNNNNNSSDNNNGSSNSNNNNNTSSSSSSNFPPPPPPPAAAAAPPPPAALNASQQQQQQQPTMDDEPTVSTSSSHSHDAPSPSSTWASTLDDEDRRERIVNNLDEAIAKCVRREDFDAAAVLKRRKERVALSAPLCKLSRQLDDAISHEEYATAAQLHDTAALWMRGWWALRGGGTNGQLIRVDREGGRLVARSFSRVDLAGGPNVHVTPVPRVPLGKRGAPGVPVFEVHVRRCADGTVEAAPFVLGIPLEIAVGVGEDVRVRTASVELEGEGEKMDVRICFDMIPPFDYDDDDEEEDDDDDDLEVMRMRAPRDDDDDDSDGGDDEEGGSLGIASTDDDDEDEDEDDLRHNHHHRMDAASAVLLHGAMDAGSSRVVVHGEYNEDDDEDDDDDVGMDDDGVLMDATELWMRQAYRGSPRGSEEPEHGWSARELGLSRLPATLEESTSSQCDAFEIMIPTAGAAPVLPSLAESAQLVRLTKQLEPSNTDSLTGMFVGSFGPHGPEALEVYRTTMDNEDMVVARKVVGDPNVPAGELSFRAKVGRSKRLEADHMYPRELGVVARYAGEGRIAGNGFRSPSWVPGELLELDGKGGSLTGGAELGFVWAVPGERRFLILFNRLVLS